MTSTSDCTYCAEFESKFEGSDPCCAAEISVYQCSRAPGHSGPHVACGTDVHEIVTWKDKL
jgi:hypothetical protein